jgi:hypothetical protein
MIVCIARRTSPMLKGASPVPGAGTLALPQARQMGHPVSLFPQMGETDGLRRGLKPLGERLDLRSTPQSRSASPGCRTRDVSRPRYQTSESPRGALPLRWLVSFWAGDRSGLGCEIPSGAKRFLTPDLGYRLSPQGLTLAKPTWDRFAERSSRQAPAARST